MTADFWLACLVMILENAMSAIEDRVCLKIQARAKTSVAHHGATMERDDLSRLDWLIHAQEEAMDIVVYLEKLIQLEGGQNGKSVSSKCIPS
jgi:hypothetical protein